MKKISLVLAILSLLVLVATFPIHSNFASKAKLIQRIEKSSSADMFGDEGTPIGEPTQYVIDDPKAFIGEPKNGVYQVDEGYLKQNNPHPLQLKTVDFFSSITQAVSGIAVVIFGLLAWRLKPKG